MADEREEWELGALREQGMRAGPVPILSSPNLFHIFASWATISEKE